MRKPAIKIAVVSDIVCPWCYIGKRRLENAIETVNDVYDFEIAYYPFELNPEMPAEGKNNKTYLVNKFGSESEYERLTRQVTRVAQGEGIEFNYDRQNVSPNTRNAHRLMMLAKDEGKQLPLAELLFKAYFTDGVDLSKNESLVQIAANAGMDRQKVELFLNSNAGITEVAYAEQELQRLGIRGVPFYIINDKYGISGAQSPEAFVKVFHGIGQELAQQGEVCDADMKNC
ncbi:MAG TPA: DsbA family oxidoreductase [Chryseosolibacter sp.]|nr:DsbA family oxidoreductase [Chryseosolibacter sp.]